MAKAAELPLFEYTASSWGHDGLPRENKVVAAYFQESGRYTVFKDEDHIALLAIRSDLVERIERSVDAVDFG